VQISSSLVDHCVFFFVFLIFLLPIFVSFLDSPLLYPPDTPSHSFSTRTRTRLFRIFVSHHNFPFDANKRETTLKITFLGSGERNCEFLGMGSSPHSSLLANSTGWNAHIVRVSYLVGSQPPPQIYINWSPRPHFNWGLFKCAVSKARTDKRGEPRGQRQTSDFRYVFLAIYRATRLTDSIYRPSI